MSRSFSNVKIVYGMITRAINPRGFASAPEGVVSRGGTPRRGAALVRKTREEVSKKVSWVPDPRTGFYRPENVAEEIDVAELRAMLLKKT